MKEIPLTRGKFALVDDEDFDELSQHKWHATNWGYAARRGPDRKLLLLHRVLLSPPPGKVVDHINRNTLDNRRENLRLATPQQNWANRKRPAGAAIPYRGIEPANGRWRARIKHAGVTRHIGMFDTMEEAAAAHDVESVRLRGEFAALNFPK